MKTCEDFPACGHEYGDCDGTLYGSDADIQAQVERAWGDGHGYCDHAEGIYMCQHDPEEEEYEEHLDEFTGDYRRYEEGE